MANKPRYDYSKFMIPEELKYKNGVYILTDGEYYYIGKADDKDYGFRQRYGKYLHNQAYGKQSVAGDKFIQSGKDVKMHWLYYCDREDVQTVKPVEDYLLKAYRIIHGDKVLNKDVKASRMIAFDDVKHYFMGNKHKGNVMLMVEHGVMRPSTEPFPKSGHYVEIKQES
ncbi:MAG: hypothetical protein H9W81_04615 [Enterococcus sp.]|nr:hypothetical protein [Enterococcus sp.]